MRIDLLRGVAYQLSQARSEIQQSTERNQHRFQEQYPTKSSDLEAVRGVHCIYQCDFRTPNESDIAAGGRPGCEDRYVRTVT